MFFNTPLHLSHGLLTALKTQVRVYHRERLPAAGAVLVISNHRSLLDVPLLMAAVNRPIRFACHHYMSQVPALKEVVSAMGGFPLDAPGQRKRNFFTQAVHLLQTHQTVGIFPEGAQPMVQATQPQELNRFHRGFAHLALRAPTPQLTIVPVAIAATEETQHPIAPLKLFSWFDPSEPLFNQPGWHPAVIYHRVNLLIGHPISITDTQREHYRGKRASSLVKQISQSCHNEIASLLRRGVH
jgi:1-acyl-sn-glycerol-3-phosphate acyltransferase